MDHAIGADGLPRANGRGLVHDVMRTADLLQRVADDLKDTALTWVDAQDISEDEYITVCQHLDEMIQGLQTTFVSAQAAYHALCTEARESPTAAAMAALLAVTTPLGEGFRPPAPRREIRNGAAR
ncbi:MULTISPECIES: hypothetical protein [unclassified Crossiella]|uniref:hypothetical protein n=1 Tax=unclassified Crossiella TaxID=2620835 RepID=UPI001FFE31F3|nr:MULTISPECIES: hypothetical protein [unclassified Crossiella]MCK2237959.1 hypothetical protein [Crossiella sp. S99.2]MCK2255242.1 hypothetical protein [Crossiella sp. S99.1]